LDAVGWPGDRTLESREYQTIEKWNGLLTSFASLDVATPPLSFGQALARLREMADASPFQIENEGAPVQIMGLLEASGLRFDHLWVAGLHDEALPAPAHPNPFLPLSLQREHSVPHSSPERELDFAKRLLAGLLASAPNVVLSYPAADGDRMLGPSPLVEGEWRSAPEIPISSEWVQRIREAASIAELHDEIAPPLTATSLQTGGASVFKDMSACAFRAFAKHRLAARALEEPVPGVSYSGKGTAVHKAMAMIWSELGSRDRLLELGPAELRELIARAAAGAVQQLGLGLGRKLERQRLERVLGEWMEIEKLRDPFTVCATEQDNVVTLGGLQVKIRADRVDRLPDGREIILDYKTGKVKSKAWQSDRPDEPQLPLYCATSSEPIAGAAFVVVRVDELRFRGLTGDGATLPKFSKMEMEAPAPFGARIEEWKVVLERLALKFREGVAEVDPKAAACDYCGLRALCRIREFENERR
jgi:probable DNA repair protein